MGADWEGGFGTMSEILEASKRFVPAVPRPLELVCNGFPVGINGTGLMLRMTNASGFQADAEGHVLVHTTADVRLLAVTVHLDVVTLGGEMHNTAVNTFHITPHAPGQLHTWYRFGLEAGRVTRTGRKGKVKRGPAAFRFDLFTPVNV
jgi:hypothetical protein